MRRPTDVSQGLSGLLRFFTSLKLTLALLVYLMAIVLVAGVFGIRTLSFDPDPAGRVLEAILLLFPLLLFMLNLFGCALMRFIRMFRRRVYFKGRGFLKIAPDLIHLSILLFIIAGLLSHYGRVEGVVSLRPGEQVLLGGDYSLRLEDFSLRKNPDGSVAQYVSTVQVLEDGRAFGETRRIMVNRPLVLGKLKIYQTGHQSPEAAGPVEGEIVQAPVSVLQAVYDPGSSLIVWGAVFCSLGMILLFIDKLGRIKNLYFGL